MEIKLKINTDKILAETGITIDEPEQWLALMDRTTKYLTTLQNCKTLTSAKRCFTRYCL